MLERTRSFAFALLLSSGLAAAVIVACGSDDNAARPDAASPDMPGTTSGVMGDSGYIYLPDGNVLLPDGGEIPDDVFVPPGPKRDFPLETPELGGYGLVELFPETMKMSIPAAVVWPATGGASPFVLERIGNVVRMEGGVRRNLLDFTADVELQSEGGALGMAIHPQFGDGSGAKPYAYFWYNAKGTPKKRQRLVRYTWSVANASFDPATKLTMVDIEEEHPEHNAGRIVFGKDGFLYFGNGDDINEANYQTLGRSLFAGIFRIDVDNDAAKSHPIPRQPVGGTTTGYMIPNDNPFVGQGGLEEYYALGFRNPFMFSFDRETNELWVGDVGDSFRETIHTSPKGGNGGWPVMEGDLVRQKDKQITIGTKLAPVSTYSHAEMGDLTAIFGGFVYRGKANPELVGKYLYSDWPSTRVWAFDPATKTRRTIISNQWERMPMAMAEDLDGEVYLLHYSGVAKIVKDTTPLDVPRRLLETKIFKDLATLTVEDGFVPYQLNSPLWSDGAAKQRWISVPAGQKASVNPDGSFKFPPGTRFIKQFDLPEGVTPSGGRTKHLETRVLVVGNATTYGLTYRWNAEGTDATLEPEGFDETIALEGGKTQVWHTPSFGQCWSCHRAENRVLGFTQKQTNRDGQPQMFADKAVIDPALVASWAAPLAQPMDTGKSLEERALAYLAANCSGCHHKGASYTGGGETWKAEPDVALAQRGLVNVANHNYPVAAGLGLTQGLAPLIKPGDPSGSLLVRRLQTDNHDLMMPPLGKNIVDTDAAKLIADWVASMSATP